MIHGYWIAVNLANIAEYNTPLLYIHLFVAIPYCQLISCSVDYVFKQSFIFFLIILESSPKKHMLLISVRLHLIISLAFSVASQYPWLVDSCKMYTQDGLASSLLLSLLFIISFNIHLNIIRESECVGNDPDERQ